MSKELLKLICVSTLALLARPAAALETPVARADYVEGKLLTATDAVGTSGTIDALLELTLDTNWHTYWRNPGDAGLPPRLEWTGSENIAEAEISWPAPMRKLELDFHTFAYQNAVALPLTIKLEEASKSAHIALKANVMVCHEICVPQVLEFTLDVPVGPATKSAQAGLIESAKANLPKADNTAELGIEGVVAGPEGLVITATSASGFEGVDVFATVDNLGFTIPPVITPTDEAGKKALIKITPPKDAADLPTYLTGKELKVVLVAGPHAIERSVKF